MNYGTLVPSFNFYKFADAISQPYTSFIAYRSGSIDEKGNFLKPESSIDPFEYFVIKLKKIFDQLPPGLTKYQLANYGASLNLFSEEAEKFGIKQEHFVALVEGYLGAHYGSETSYIELIEDMSAGGMATAGGSPGYNTGSVSGFDPVLKPSPRRRPVSDEMFHMFDVSPDDFGKITSNKMNEIDYLRRFGVRNPNSTIMVRNKKDGSLYSIPKKKKLKEEFNLNFLFEELKNMLLEDRQKVTEIFKKMVGVADPQNPESRKKRGDEQEYLGRLVHSIRSLHAVHKADPKKGIDTFISAFDPLSGKNTAENGFDAIEYDIDSSGDLSRKNLDVKGVSTTISQRPDIPFQTEIGIRQEIVDAGTEARKALEKIDQEVISKSNVKELKDTIRSVPKVKSAVDSLRKQLNANLQKRGNESLARDYILGKFKLTGSAGGTPTGWSFIQLPTDSKRMVLSPEPGEGQTKLPAIVSGSALDRVLRNTRIFGHRAPSVGITVKRDENSAKGVVAVPDVALRIPDLSIGRQQALQTDAINLGTGHLTHAHLDNDMMGTLKSYIDDENLFNEIVDRVKGFIR